VIRRAFDAVARWGYNFAAAVAVGEFRRRPYRLYADSELAGRYHDLGEALSVARDMQAMGADVEVYRAKPQLVTVKFERVEFERGESE